MNFKPDTQKPIDNSEEMNPNDFFSSLSENKGGLFKSCENKDVIDLSNKLKSFIETHEISRADGQNNYHSNTIYELQNFSGYITSYQKLIDKFGYNNTSSYYPDLNYQINFFNELLAKELSPKAQVLINNMIENMYEHIYVIKKLFKNEIIQEWQNNRKFGPKNIEESFEKENNYHLSQYFVLNLPNYDYYLDEGEKKLNQFIEELVVMREKRLSLAKELEKELLESETLFLKEKGVL